MAALALAVVGRSLIAVARTALARWSLIVPERWQIDRTVVSAKAGAELGVKPSQPPQTRPDSWSQYRLAHPGCPDGTPDGDRSGGTSMKMLVLITAAALLGGCAQSGRDYNLIGGAVVGGGTGAVIGGLATRSAGGAVAGGLIGAAAGGIVGAATSASRPCYFRSRSGKLRRTRCYS
jgi:osmotically inducible lipoprotein OsmB